MTPFEYDLCIYRKLKFKNPDPTFHQDKLLLGLIRRMNLDAFWLRASSTIVKNAKRAKMTIKLLELVGLPGPYKDHRSYDLQDHYSYQVSANILLQLQQPGKHESIYTQYHTIRKQRATFGNQVRASVSSNTNPLVLVDEKGGYRRLVNNKCRSFWFSCFMLRLGN